MSLPPSRSLTQQRDYRQRRAQYIADLEVRCRKAEEENVQLRHEVSVLKAKQSATSAILDPHAVRFAMCTSTLGSSVDLSFVGRIINNVVEPFITRVCLSISIPSTDVPKRGCCQRC